MLPVHGVKTRHMAPPFFPLPANGPTHHHLPDLRTPPLRFLDTPIPALAELDWYSLTCHGDCMQPAQDDAHPCASIADP